MPSGRFTPDALTGFSNLWNGRRLSSRRQYPVDRRPPNVLRGLHRKVVPVAHLAPALEADQHGERDQQLLTRRLRQPRELRPVHQLHSLDIGEAHHNNARPEFDQLIQARDNAPQRPHFFRRLAFAVAGLIAGWMKSAARLPSATPSVLLLWGLRPNIRRQQRTGDDGPVEPQICHLPTGREGVYYTPSIGNAS